jgi:2-polyprenyl-3-methyl-5-hydroxy-6-metoxy-1,4-benzoquinol methylase
MKKVCCYLCGSSKSDILFKQEGHDPYLAKVYKSAPDHDLNWMICNDCGFVYRSPALTEQELEILYKSYDQDEFSNTTPDEYFDKIMSFPNEESENWQKIAWLKEVISNDERKDIFEALDIGCGGGTLLYTAREELSLRSVSGVELNEVYADLARRRLDASILNQNYVSGLFKKQFDLLINTKVLEHVADPLPFLKEMYDDLRNGGLLFIEVPDVSDMYSLPPTHERFWIPHIYFFSGNTLSALLRKVGFQIVAHRVIKTHRKRSYLQFVAEKTEAKSDKISVKPFDDVESMKKLISLNFKKLQK